MSTLMTILNIVPALLRLIVAVEEVFPQSGAGGEKLAMVKNIIQASYDGISELMPIIETVVAAVVKTANAIGAFTKGV